MQRFIAKQNIEHFRQLIATEGDARKLEVLRHLLAEEEAKLAGLLVEAKSLPPKAANESDER